MTAQVEPLQLGRPALNATSTISLWLHMRSTRTPPISHPEFLRGPTRLCIHDFTYSYSNDPKHSPNQLPVRRVIGQRPLISICVQVCPFFSHSFQYIGPQITSKIMDPCDTYNNQNSRQKKKHGERAL